MIIAAICFLVYELYKMFNSKSVNQTVTMLEAGNVKDANSWVVFFEFAYYVWIIVGLVWFPHWRGVLGAILALVILKNFIPRSERYIIIDSVVTALLLVGGIIYTMLVMQGIV